MMALAFMSASYPLPCFLKCGQLEECLTAGFVAGIARCCESTLGAGDGKRKIRVAHGGVNVRLATFPAGSKRSLRNCARDAFYVEAGLISLVGVYMYV